MIFELLYRENYTGYNIFNNNYGYSFDILIMCSFLIHPLIVFAIGVKAAGMETHHNYN